MKHVPIMGEIIRFYPSDKYKIGKFTWVDVKNGGSGSYEMKFMGWALAAYISDDQKWYCNELVPAFLDEDAGSFYGRIITLETINDESSTQNSLIALV